MGTVSAQLDYIRYTIPWWDSLSEIDNLNRAKPPGNLFPFTGELFSPGQGYTDGMRMAIGAIMWHKTRPEQGIGVVLTGGDLEAVRVVGFEEMDLLRFITAAGGRSTTLHGCIDARDLGSDVQDLIDAHERGALVTSARNIGVYSSKTKVGGKWQTGDTLYVGSAKSERQVRIYNKAAEQGITADWVRLEIVWRGPYAEAAHIAMLASGIASVTRAGISGQLGAFVKWFVDALSGELAPTIAVPRKQSARAKWLINVVIPALMKELGEEARANKNEVYRAFKDVIDSQA